MRAWRGEGSREKVAARAGAVRVAEEEVAVRVDCKSGGYCYSALACDITWCCMTRKTSEKRVAAVSCNIVPGSTTTAIPTRRNRRVISASSHCKNNIRKGELSLPVLVQTRCMQREGTPMCRCALQANAATWYMSGLKLLYRKESAALRRDGGESPCTWCLIMRSKTAVVNSKPTG